MADDEGGKLPPVDHVQSYRQGRDKNERTYFKSQLVLVLTLYAKMALNSVNYIVVILTAGSNQRPVRTHGIPLTSQMTSLRVSLTSLDSPSTSLEIH